jgi:hypothetical protein
VEAVGILDIVRVFCSQVLAVCFLCLAALQ